MDVLLGACWVFAVVAFTADPSSSQPVVLEGHHLLAAAAVVPVLVNPLPPLLPLLLIIVPLIELPRAPLNVEVVVPDI